MPTGRSFPRRRLNDRWVRSPARMEARRTLDLFEIPGHRGSLRSAGVGKSIAGNAADGAIIDDPFGKREDADSAVIRQRVWDWYANDLYTPALATDAWIVLTHTRWHRDDLAGRLLRKMADRAADQWETLCLPAIREEGPGDPLRQPRTGRPAVAGVQVGGRPGDHPPAGRQGLRGLVPAEPRRGLDGGVAAVLFRRLDLGAAGEVAAGVRPAGGLRRCQQGQERQAGRLLGDRVPGRGQATNCCTSTRFWTASCWTSSSARSCCSATRKSLISWASRPSSSRNCWSTSFAGSAASNSPCGGRCTGC